MNRPAPGISVITPLFNKGRYVGDTVRSVLCQTFPDWELIVVDNGSTDDGPAIVLGFEDSRIHYLSISERGPGVARNRGIAAATGEWLFFLDADDLIEPDYLTRQLQTARQNPQAQVVVSPWQIFPDGDLSNRTRSSPAGSGGLEPSRELLDTAIAFTPWAPVAAIVRASTLPVSLRWPEELDKFLAEDTTFWFRIVNELRVVYSESAGALYRADALGCRTRIDNAGKWFEGNHEAVSANLRFLSKTNRLVSDAQCESLMRLYSELYMNALRTGDSQTARNSLSRAEHWLAERSSRRTPANRTVRLRRLMGIPAYSHLTVWAKSLLPRVRA